MGPRSVAFGVRTRTGAAVLVALTDGGSTAVLAGRWDVELVPAALPVQPYHAAADLQTAEAERLVAQVEQVAEDAAVEALESALSELTASTVCGVAVVVKPASVPSEVGKILRSHAAMHSAEGVLYRETMLAAARRCNLVAHAVEEATLPAAESVVRDVGRAAGRPWRRIEKDATRAALTLLPTS